MESPLKMFHLITLIIIVGSSLTCFFSQLLIWMEHELTRCFVFFFSVVVVFFFFHYYNNNNTRRQQHQQLKHPIPCRNSFNKVTIDYSASSLFHTDTLYIALLSYPQLCMGADHLNSLVLVVIPALRLLLQLQQDLSQFLYLFAQCLLVIFSIKL